MRLGLSSNLDPRPDVIDFMTHKAKEPLDLLLLPNGGRILCLAEEFESFEAGRDRLDAVMTRLSCYTSPLEIYIKWGENGEFASLADYTIWLEQSCKSLAALNKG